MKIDRVEYIYLSGFYSKRKAKEDAKTFRAEGASIRIVHEKKFGRSFYAVYVKRSDWRKVQ